MESDALAKKKQLQLSIICTVQSQWFNCSWWMNNTRLKYKSKLKNVLHWRWHWNVVFLQVKGLQFWQETLMLSQRFNVLQEFITLPAGRRIRLVQKKTSGCQLWREVNTDPPLFKYFMSVLSQNNRVLKVVAPSFPSFLYLEMASYTGETLYCRLWYIQIQVG